MALSERLGRYGLDSIDAYAIGLGAIVFAMAAGWLAADLLPRWLTVPVVAVAVGTALVAAPGRRAILGRYLGAWSSLLVLAPVLYVLPALLRAEDLGVGRSDLVLAESAMLVLVGFWILAAVVGVAAWRLGRG
ncbi:MAG: hypothetical protein ACOC0X_06945 [Halobacteriota archaeon]